MRLIAPARITQTLTSAMTPALLAVVALTPLPSTTSAQVDPSAVTRALDSVCAPVIQSGESLEEQARTAGFRPTEAGEEQDMFGEGWVKQDGTTVLILGDTAGGGDPCRMMVLTGGPGRQPFDLHDALNDWATQRTPSLPSVVSRVTGENGVESAWRRRASGVWLTLELVQTQTSGMTIAMVGYGLSTGN